MKRLPLLALALILCAPLARADEGMWTFDNFPKDKVQKKYGFGPDAAWLERARLSSVRLSGCSGSFVSADALVMTNHHCVRSCVQQLSTKEKNFMSGGFYAQSPEQETRCPELEVVQLLQITDVTRRVETATKGTRPGSPEYNKAQKTEKTTIEKECAGNDVKLRCDVVDLYHGGVYALYRYHRYQDVRLVFAPEFQAAKFGGDPDNFQFPRFALDMGFVRPWEDGKPARTDHFFKWSESGAKEGDLTFVSGNPGSTQRQRTLAEIVYERDVAIPERLLALAEWRGYLYEFSKGSPEHARIAEIELLGTDNAYKGIRGRRDTLIDERFLKWKQDSEVKLRAKVKGNGGLEKKAGDAWARLARVLDEYRPHRHEYAFIEDAGQNTPGLFGSSRLGRFARILARGTAEREKPETERLREYRDTAMPPILQTLFSKAPIYDDLEVLKLSYSLGKLRENLGPDHPVVKKVLGKKSPEALAAELVANTKLKDPALRKEVWDAGFKAVQASQDPLVQLALVIDGDGRSLRKWHDDDIEAPEKAATEALAQARFALEGTSTYPDATFTPRLSYGALEGWSENGRRIAPFTTFAGAYDRHTGAWPFQLPDSYLNAKERVKLDTPLDFATSNDIIGGNSGSPVFNKQQEIVGLIFDGNLPSLGGDYFFNPSDNRAVAVHSSGILEALEHIYGAKRIVQELHPKGAPASGGK